MKVTNSTLLLNISGTSHKAVYREWRVKILGIHLDIK